MHSQLLIGSFIHSLDLTEGLERYLDNQHHRIHRDESAEPFLQWVANNRHRVDCLVLQPSAALVSLLQSLQARDIVLPTLVLLPEEITEAAWSTGTVREEACRSYHKAIAHLPYKDLGQVEQYIHQSIARFLQLPHNQGSESAEMSSLEDTRHFLLSLQQQRLSEKLRERLGYLGIYYKRNPENFLRHLTPPERRELLDKLRSDYRVIILSYFAQESTLNQKIDDFVNTAFFADASVSQIVEIHMELMESFSKQLKLEGRSEEILLDYRLTLIDVIAHLCEMYRRSIPRDM